MGKTGSLHPCSALTKQTCAWFKRRCICLMHCPSTAWAGKMLSDAAKGSGNRLAVKSMSLSCTENALAGTCSSFVCTSLNVQAHQSQCWPCHGLFYSSLVAVSFMLDCKPSHAVKTQIGFAWLSPLANLQNGFPSLLPCSHNEYQSQGVKSHEPKQP